MPEVKGVWTAEDVALVLIDYQKEMFENVRRRLGLTKLNSTSGS
jgi:hypothetical protein